MKIMCEPIEANKELLELLESSSYLIDLINATATGLNSEKVFFFFKTLIKVYEQIGDLNNELSELNVILDEFTIKHITDLKIIMSRIKVQPCSV